VLEVAAVFRLHGLPDRYPAPPVWESFSLACRAAGRQVHTGGSAVGPGGVNEIRAQLYPISETRWERGRRIALCVVMEVDGSGVPVERTGRLTV
jgi:hypothetical protein